MSDQVTAPSETELQGSGAGFVLPQLPTMLFGREEDLRGLAELLSGEDVRLVTLTGAPGIGKTSLSIAVGRDWERRTQHHVHFVQLGSISDPDLFLPTLAVGLKVRPSRRVPLIEHLAVQIRRDPVLLVLDNFEHILAAGDDVVGLLLQCPNLKILVTSRSPLRVRGEYLWEVLPLRLPLPGEVRQSSELELNPAVALLLDRAGPRQSGIRLTPNNAAAIASLCIRLGGIPLAIELAAPWLRLFSPEVLLHRLSQPLELLRGGARDLPSRQQTLASAIGWSDNLLEEDERRLFHRLSVFEDGWTLEAVEAVCADDDGRVGTRTVLQCLVGLLEKSLIHREADFDGSPRFSMLEMIREFARVRLEEEGEADVMHQRHADYFQRLIHDAVPHLYREDQGKWMDRLEREIGNIRATLRWWLDCGDKLAGSQLATRLENFWLVHDHLEEGQRWLEECLRLDVGSYPASEARARHVLSTLLVRRGEYQRAEQLRLQTLSFARDNGDVELLAQTLLALGSLHFIAGDLVQAQSQFGRALGLGQRINDRRTIALALNQLGEVDRFNGDDVAASAHYEESLAIWRELAERERIAMILHNLAPVVARSGTHSRAVELFRESLEISWDLRNLHGLALCLSGIAGIIDSPASAIIGAALLGASDAFRDVIGVHWQPVDRAEFERSLARVRSLLEAGVVEQEFARGAEWTPTQAYEQARALLEEDATVRAGVRPAVGRARGGLSRREFEIATRVTHGLTNREIAQSLHISEKTVEMHISNALRKLGLRSRVQLSAWIVRHQQPQAGHSAQPPYQPSPDPNAGENTGTPPIH